jgi:nicotinamidase-related amidase
LTRIHTLLPKSREERLKVPITVRGTWDAQIIDEIKPKEDDYIIIKRRDSAFQPLRPALKPEFTDRMEWTEREIQTNLYSNAFLKPS